MHRLSFIIICLLFFACSKKQKTASGGHACTIDCAEQLIVPEFRYHDSTSIDTILVKIYEPDSSFKNLVKQSWYYDGCKSLYMEHGNDYELILNNGDRFRIWGFDTQEPTKKETWCPDFCYYYTRKLLVDGKIVYPYYGQYTSTLVLFEK